MLGRSPGSSVSSKRTGRMYSLVSLTARSRALRRSSRVHSLAAYSAEMNITQTREPLRYDQEKLAKKLRYSLTWIVWLQQVPRVLFGPPVTS